MKRMQTHHLYLASKDREDFNNSDPSNCRLNVAKSLNPDCISLSFAQFPNTYYNITSKNNKFEASGSLYEVQPGTYNLGDLMQAFANLLAADSVTVSFDDVIGRIIISTTALPTLDLNFDVADSIHAKLGFKKRVYDDSPTHTGNFVPKIYDTSIFISINGINSGCIASPTVGGMFKNVQNATFIVPNNVNKGEIIQFYQHSQFHLSPKVNDTINYFDVRFFDDDGNLLQNLGEWAMMIELKYSK
jgi:hypothetical protein